MTFSLLSPFMIGDPVHRLLSLINESIHVYECLVVDVYDGGADEHAVAAVGHAAVAGDEAAEVLKGGEGERHLRSMSSKS